MVFTIDNPFLSSTPTPTMNSGATIAIIGDIDGTNDPTASAFFIALLPTSDFLLPASLSTDIVSPSPLSALGNLYPLKGTFTWSTAWEEHPSGSFSFITRASDRSSIITALIPGREFNAYGVGFRVDTLSIEELTTGQIVVTVSLGGRHENYTDRVVPLRVDTLSASNTAAPATATSVAELAQRAGDQFSGPGMPIDIATDTSLTEGTTFASEAQQQVRQNGCFLRFSSPNAVEAVGLGGVPTWNFAETDILSKSVNCSINGGANLGDIYPFPHTYDPPNLLEWGSDVANPGVGDGIEDEDGEDGNDETDNDNDEDEDETTQGDAPDDTKPNWKFRPRVHRTLEEGDLNPQNPPSHTNALKDLSNLFSSSGTTKTYKISSTEDGLPTTETLRRYGFAFLGKDMYSGTNLVGVSPGNAWRQIEEKTTTYFYNQKGYQTGSTTTGWELIRYLEESSQSPETMTLDSDDPEDAEKLQLYEYFQNPYRREEKYALTSFKSTYNDPDESLQGKETYEVTLPSGQVETKTIADPTYVQPYFAHVSVVHENNFKVVANPDSTEEEPLPPITTGRESFYRKLVKVVNASSGGISGPLANTGGLNVTGGSSDEDIYNEYVTQFSSSDASFGNSLDNTYFTKNYGRPGTATSLPPTFERVDPNAPIPIEPPSDIFQGEIVVDYVDLEEEENQETEETEENTPGDGTSEEEEAEAVAALPPTIKYLVQTPGANSTLEGSSLSYPRASTLAQAQTAASTDITIQNIKDSLQESFTIPFSPQIKAGDRLTYACNGEIRSRRVLNISHEVEIRGVVNGQTITTSKGSQVSLGLERATPVSFSSVVVPVVVEEGVGVGIEDSNEEGEGTEDVNDAPDQILFTDAIASIGTPGDGAPAPGLNYTTASSMGEIDDPGMQTRRNFVI